MSPVDGVTDPDEIARQCLRGLRAAASDEQYQQASAAIREAIHNAFDLGFLAAGGQIFPWPTVQGVQPDPDAARMVSKVAELLERHGDAFFDEDKR